MTKERLEDLIEIFCDADFRAKLRPETAKQYCPTLEEAIEATKGAE